MYYQCEEGYYFNGGRNFSECTIDQSWENITFVCKGTYYCRRLVLGMLFVYFHIPVLKVGTGGRCTASCMPNLPCRAYGGTFVWKSHRRKC